VKPVYPEPVVVKSKLPLAGFAFLMIRIVPQRTFSDALAELFDVFGSNRDVTVAVLFTVPQVATIVDELT